MTARKLLLAVATFKAWRLTPECLTERDKLKNEFRDTCPSRMITPNFYGDKWKDIEASHERLRVNDDFTKLIYQHRALRGSVENELVSISLEMLPLHPEPQLDYLALGDSYSSGEGDIYNGKTVNYILETGGKGGCHLSSRSYPFLLAQYWGLGTGRFQSIACSGARVAHDYISRPQYYVGQNDDIKGKIKSGDKTKVTRDAIDKFLPGYVPQIEFVKKYQPKVITLTGGGNDVGFADVIKSCADTNLKEISTAWKYDWLTAETCSYVNGRTHQLLIDAIYNQYGMTKLLIKKLKEASSKSKIYIIGYPQFVSNRSAVCGISAGLMNTAEREFTHEMVKKMNGVLWRAATDSGVPFVDIEDVLDGGKLCEPKHYMTGVDEIPLAGFKIYEQNAFHPNPSGHKKIAKRIYDKIGDLDRVFDGDTVLAEAAQTYDSSPKVLRLARDFIKTVMNGSKLRVYSESIFKAHSKITVTLYSDPVNLGEFSVGDDGLIDIDVTIPKSIKPGAHMLIIDGQDDNGQPVTYYDFITVTQNQDREIGDVDLQSSRNDKRVIKNSSEPSAEIQFNSDTTHQGSFGSISKSSESKNVGGRDSEKNISNKTILWWLLIITGVILIGGIIYAILRKSHTRTN